MKKRRLTREQKILFNRVFVGKADPDNVEEYIEYPQIHYLKLKYADNNIDIESIAVELWMKLIDEGREFNWTYFKKAIIYKFYKEYAKEVTRLKRETRGLTTGDIKTDENVDDGWESPEIAWKEPLTEEEQQLADLLIEGYTQREINSMTKFHPNKQSELKKSIKNKMEII